MGNPGFNQIIGGIFGLTMQVNNDSFQGPWGTGSVLG